MSQYKYKHLILRDLKKNPLNYENLDMEYKLHNEVLTQCLKATSDIGQFFPEEIKSDRGFFIKYLPVNPFIFRYMNEQLQKDSQLIDLMLKNYQSFCNSMYNRDNIDKDRYENTILSYFPNLSHNKKIVLKVIESFTNNHYHTNENYFFKKIIDNLNEKLSDDVSFLSVLVKRNYKIYEHLKPSIKDEPDIMVSAMKSSKGEAFPLFNDDFKADPFFITHMLQYGEIYKGWLPKELRAEIGSHELTDYFKKILLKESIEKAVNEQVGDIIETPKRKLKI